jgi:hypothetical protein
MNIFEVSSVLNEQLLFDIKSKNNKDYINKFHVVESNFTYKYKKKDYVIKNNFNHVALYQVNFEELFYKPSIKLSRYFSFFDRSKYAWLNEAIQRNYLTNTLKANLRDDDILIISDLDEIINFSNLDKILYYLKKYNFITIKLYQTMFFFNLFNSSDKSGPPGWSYRIFIMYGKVFKRLRYTIDGLRIKGVQGILKDEVFCPDEYMGFHHSWVGDIDKIIYKINSYSHTYKDHKTVILDQNGKIDVKKIEELVKNKISIMDNPKLYLDSTINLLPEVLNIKKIYPQFFINN